MQSRSEEMFWVFVLFRCLVIKASFFKYSILHVFMSKTLTSKNDLKDVSLVKSLMVVLLYFHMGALEIQTAFTSAARCSLVTLNTIYCKHHHKILYVQHT